MSLGRDLSTIRNEKKLTLDDVHNITKIPVHILEAAEQDTLLSKASENKTYLRSYIRSFAKALGIPEDYIISAIDAVEAGNYDHNLLKLIHPEIVQEEFSIKKDEIKISEVGTEGSSDEADITEAKPETKPDLPEEKMPPQTPGQPVRAIPTVDSVDWGDMSRKIYFTKKNSKTFVIVFFLIVILGGMFAVYYNYDKIAGLFESEPVYTDTTKNSEAETESRSSAGEEAAAEDAGIQSDESTGTNTDDGRVISAAEKNENILGDTLTIVLYAAFDKLEPVRVTSDLNWKTNPFWLDEGQAGYFRFKDSLLIRGQYTRMLLSFNDHIIENARQNYFSGTYNSILITREILSNPRFLSNEGKGYPVNIMPPDSIEYFIKY